LEPREYERLAAVEDAMWWFRGLHANLIAAWRVAAKGGEGRVLLDAGCGTGGFLAALRHDVPEAFALGVEIDEGACRCARARGGGAILAGDVARLPVADGAVDAVFSADVLCHRGVDEKRALEGFRRCLRPGGVLVLNLPAYRWLYSAHDAAVDNVRRYGRGEVLSLLAAAGFAAARAHYWNSVLFPLMVARRKLGRARSGSEVALLPPAVERLFLACVVFEARLAAAGARFPFGGSILATAVRP
jgi:SAM-dependent methyltransferase